MKYSYDLVLSDISILLEHIDDCMSEQNGNSYQYIVNQYGGIISRTPYSWYFCDGLDFDDVDKGYGAIKNAIEMLKGRLELALQHKTFQIEAVFEDIKPKIISEIEKSTHNIDIAVAWLSDSEIVNALVNASDKGIVIRIILYEAYTNRSTIAKFNKKSNVAIYSVPSFGNDGKNLMHNKFAIFDSITVLTGSYNWSFNASQNIENVVIIIDENMARSFSQKFQQLLSQFSNNKV